MLLALMIVVTCCITKLFHMVRNMQPPGNQGALMEPNRTIHHQNALRTAWEPTPRRYGAVERTRKKLTRN